MIQSKYKILWTEEEKEMLVEEICNSLRKGEGYKEGAIQTTKRIPRRTLSACMTQINKIVIEPDSQNKLIEALEECINQKRDLQKHHKLLSNISFLRKDYSYLSFLGSGNGWKES